jgi:hypothetical protein
MEIISAYSLYDARKNSIMDSQVVAFRVIWKL